MLTKLLTKGFHQPLWGALRGLSSFKHKDLQIVKSGVLQAKPDWEKLIFGHHFSDHMLSVDWTKEKGWSNPRIHPLTSISLHPGAKVFHYANELFEGMKAYHGVDGSIRMFRPEENMKRMKKSAVRAAMPDFDANELIQCIKDLISLDHDWVPKQRGKSLYIRPTMIATDHTIGVTVPTKILLYVILGPVGPYYPTGLKPVSLLADVQYTRAWPGGVGDCKLGANYAPTVYVQQEAAKQGCQQVMWLFGKDHQITEVGTMNVFMLWTNEKGEKELITPPLDGLVLPGVTRMSVLDMAREWGDFKVTEGVFTMGQLEAGLKEGRVMEMFGSGTACVVCPIERILYEGRNLAIPTMRDGAPITMKLLKQLTDIHYGVTAPHPWTQDVNI